MKKFSLILFLLALSSWAREPITGSRFEHLSGKKSRSSSQTNWNKKYKSSKFIYGKAPVKFLSENTEVLKVKGRILDMGMGEGRNAVFLARKGHDVTGIDISSVAVKKAHLLAKEFGVKINGVVASLNKYPIKPGSFDALLSFYYLDRSLIPKMKKWLAPGGLVFIESYTTKEKKKMSQREISENTFVRPGELLKLFSGFNVIKFEELPNKTKSISSIILQKPSK